jgi:hypothetical protein
MWGSIGVAIVVVLCEHDIASWVDVRWKPGNRGDRQSHRLMSQHSQAERHGENRLNVVEHKESLDVKGFRGVSVGRRICLLAYHESRRNDRAAS